MLLLVKAYSECVVQEELVGIKIWVLKNHWTFDNVSIKFTCE